MTFKIKPTFTQLSCALIIGLAGCQKASAPTTAPETAETPAASSEAGVNVSLDDFINHPRRADASARDQFRNPKATLEFFGLEPGQTVVEIWPGWYTDIIAPYQAQTGGQYIATLRPDGINQRYDRRNAAFKEKYSDSSVYGDVSFGALAQGVYAAAPEGSADMVLTFRNVHNWMKGGYAQDAFNAFYAALKPGGILGVVEHRLPESAEQDPKGRSGYAQESYMKDLASQAGFEFVASSEINANPKDTADHPFGVWTLPPVSRVGSEQRPAPADFNPELYKNIGESDRATLKFRKPL